MAAEPFAVEAPIPDIVGQAEALNDVSKKFPIPLTVNTENLPERFNAFMDGVAQYLEEYNEEYSEWFVDALPDLLNAYQSYTIDKDGETYQKAVEEFCDLAQQKMQQEGLENVMIAAREFDKAPEQLLKELYQNVEEFRLMNRVMTKQGEQYWFEDYEFERLSTSIEDLRMDKQINVVALEKDFFKDIAKPLFVNHAVDRIVTVSTNYVNETNNFAFAHFVVLSQFYGSATILRELFVNAEKQRQEIVSLIRRSELIGNAVDIGDVTPDESVSDYQGKLAFLAYILSAEEEFKTELDPLIPIDKSPAARQAAVYNALRKDYVLERDTDALFERGRASLLYRINYLLDLTQGTPEQSEHYANDKLYRDGYNVVNDLVGKDNKTFLSVFVHRGIQVYLEMFIEDVADDIGPKDEASVLISELQVLQTAMIFHGIYEDPIYFDPDILDPEKNGEQFNLLITENIKMRLGESAFDLKLFREDAEAPENEKIGFWFEVILGATGGLVLGAVGAITIFDFAKVSNAAKTVWKYIRTNVWAQRLIGATILSGLVYLGVYTMADDNDIENQGYVTTLVSNTQVYWAKYTRGIFKDTVIKTPDGRIELNVTDYVNSAFYVMNATFVTKFGADLVTAYRKSSGNSLEQSTSKERSQSIRKAIYGWLKTMYNSSALGIQSVLYAGYAFMTLDIYNFIRIGVVKIAGSEWIDAASGVILSVYQNSTLADYAKAGQEMFFDQVISLLGQAYPSIRMGVYVGVPLVAAGYWLSNAHGGNRQSKRLFQILGLQFILAFTASAIMNNDPSIGQAWRLLGGSKGRTEPYNYSIDDASVFRTEGTLSAQQLAIPQAVSLYALAVTGIAFSQKLAGQVAKSFGTIRKSFAQREKEARDAAMLRFLREHPANVIDPTEIIDSDVDSTSWAAEAKQAALAAVAVRYDNSERLRQHLAKTYQSTVDEIKQSEKDFRS